MGRKRERPLFFLKNMNVNGERSFIVLFHIAVNISPYIHSIKTLHKFKDLLNSLLAFFSQVIYYSKTPLVPLFRNLDSLAIGSSGPVSHAPFKLTGVVIHFL